MSKSTIVAILLLLVVTLVAYQYKGTTEADAKLKYETFYRQVLNTSIRLRMELGNATSITEAQSIHKRSEDYKETSFKKGDKLGRSIYEEYGIIAVPHPKLGMDFATLEDANNPEYGFEWFNCPANGDYNECRKTILTGKMSR